MESKDKEIKVYVVGDSIEYANFILNKVKFVNKKNKADIIIFTGGEDVHPDYYGEEMGIRTYCNRNRDDREIQEYFESIETDALIIGICRGAQFLCVMSGGSLIQHVDGHAIINTHKINIVDEKRDIDITSTHHQMMYPFLMDSENYKIIAKSSKKLSNTYLNGWDNEKSLTSNFVEPEIVYFNETNCLCIQGHPEYMDKKSDAVRFINVLIDELLDPETRIVKTKKK